MDIVIPLYEGFTALDAIGPYEVLSRLPNAVVRFVASEVGEVRTDVGSLGIVADYAMKDVISADVLVVPGGPGARKLIANPAMDEWLRTLDATTTWTTSVCTGSLLLASAGLLAGCQATTHWSAMATLAELGAVPVEQRVVVVGKRVSSAGVSAGIDMALTLAAEIAGEQFSQLIQLGIEYDPQPPFDAGSIAKAPRDIVEMARAALG